MAGGRWAEGHYDAESMPPLAMVMQVYIHGL